MKMQYLTLLEWYKICVGELQAMSDVLIYTSHCDPQLRGNAALVIGRFVRAVLGEGRGSWDSLMASFHPAVMCSKSVYLWQQICV